MAPKAPFQSIVRSFDAVAACLQVLVIADAEAPVAHVAADLLSQAEHGPDSQVCCVPMDCLDLANRIFQCAGKTERVGRAQYCLRLVPDSQVCTSTQGIG